MKTLRRSRLPKKTNVLKPIEKELKPIEDVLKQMEKLIKQHLREQVTEHRDNRRRYQRQLMLPQQLIHTHTHTHTHTHMRYPSSFVLQRKATLRTPPHTHTRTYPPALTCNHKAPLPLSPPDLV